MSLDMISRHPAGTHRRFQARLLSRWRPSQEDFAENRLKDNLLSLYPTIQVTSKRIIPFAWAYTPRDCQSAVQNFCWKVCIEIIENIVNNILNTHFAYDSILSDEASATKVLNGACDPSVATVMRVFLPNIMILLKKLKPVFFFP